MVFANLLLNYDIKPIAERPKTEWLGSVALPPMKATIKSGGDESRGLWVSHEGPMAIWLVGMRAFCFVM